MTDANQNQTDSNNNAAPDQQTTLLSALAQGNRETIVDKYINKPFSDEPKNYEFKVYIRLNAVKKTHIRNVSFQHSIFENCYFNNCYFDSCNFTGCKFVGCNFNQTSFSGCRFEYATFERCTLDDDILTREAPAQENLKLKFARTLRMNFQQIGDAKAVNKAISLELEATSIYLKKSWSSSEDYYQKKYGGFKRLTQFRKWLEFYVLDFIWGNGENSLKLLRTILLIHLAITIYDTLSFENAWDLRNYLNSLVASPGAFFGVSYPHNYPSYVSSLIATTRLVSFAFLTAILVKRFGRR